MAARGAIAVQEINKNAGAAVTETAIAAGGAADGLTLVNDGKTKLVVLNSGSSALTIIARGVACSHGRTSDLTVATLAAGAVAILGPFEQGLFNQSTGVINIDFTGSDVATGKVGAIRTP